MVSQHSLWSLLHTSKHQRPVESFACHKALAIPEILEHILRYLSQYIIRHIVGLVCKQWLCIARQLLPLRIDWALNLKLPEHQRTLEILPSAQILSLVPYGTDSRRICDSYPDNTYRNTIWNEVLRAIQDIQAKDEGSTLRELIVRGDLLNHRYFQDLLPYQSRTSVLRLKDLGIKPGREFLHKIFKACSVLDELHVECWNFSRSYSPVANEDIRHSPSEPFPVIPLKVLDVNGFVISQGCMEAILEAVPRLVEFRIVGAWRQKASPEAQPTINIVNGATAADNNNNGVASASPAYIPPPASLSHVGVLQDFDYSALFHLVARSCQRLRRFHFSIHDQRYTEKDFATLLGEDFPALRERSFSQNDLPFLMRRILPSASTTVSAETETTIANPVKTSWSYITSLELIPLHQTSEVVGSSLQSYLCTAVHLRHLIAPNVLIDVSNVKADIPKSGICEGFENPGRKIWACRNLQTLHITFKGTVQEFAARSTSVTIFGYISIVCPRLVDLQIRGYFMNLTQSGGLCLLSRLRDLEKLTIVAKKCLQFSKKDVAWIRPLPTLLNKLTAMPTVLKTQSQQGQQITTASGGGGDSKVERLGSQKHDDVDSVVDWSSIAKANNLEEWARERDFEAWQGKSCLPRLGHFQILVDNGIKESCRQAEHFMKEIRPHTKIELRYKKY